MTLFFSAPLQSVYSRARGDEWVDKFHMLWSVFGGKYWQLCKSLRSKFDCTKYPIEKKSSVRLFLPHLAGFWGCRMRRGVKTVDDHKSRDGGSVGRSVGRDLHLFLPKNKWTIASASPSLPTPISIPCLTPGALQDLSLMPHPTQVSLFLLRNEIH